MFFLDFSKNGRGGGDISSKKQLVEGCLASKEWVYFQGVGIFHESARKISIMKRAATPGRVRLNLRRNYFLGGIKAN